MVDREGASGRLRLRRRLAREQNQYEDSEPEAASAARASPPCRGPLRQGHELGGLDSVAIRLLTPATGSLCRVHAQVCQRQESGVAARLPGSLRSQFTGVRSICAPVLPGRQDCYRCGRQHIPGKWCARQLSAHERAYQVTENCLISKGRLRSPCGVPSVVLSSRVRKSDTVGPSQ